MTALLGAALWSLTALGSPAAAAPPDSLVGPGDEVPFVPQGPMLCGGAAAAMVERYWGTRGVYDEDFDHLVRDGEGGIRASELSAALRRRGYGVRAITNRPLEVLEAVERAVPPILLLASGNGKLHYVVMVGFDSDEISIHDPDFGPSRRVPRAELMGRWSASRYLALLVVPDSAQRHASAAPPPHGAGAGSDPDSLPSSADSALALLRSGDYGAAQAAAMPLLEGRPSERETGRRILATAAYLAGDPDGALDHWNAVGEPRVDLVEISGARHSRYHALQGRTGVEPGQILTRPALELARRRLAESPAVRRARVDYQPLPDGTVEVRAAVLERERTPPPALIAAEALGAIATKEVALEVGPFAGAPGRWRIEGAWRVAQRRLRGAFATSSPALPGVAHVFIEWRAERYAATPTSEGSTVAAEEQRTGGWAELAEWIRPSLRVSARVGVERWSHGGRMLAVGSGAQWAVAGDDGRLSIDVDAWTGAASDVLRAGLRGALEVPVGSHGSWRAEAGAVVVSAGAPRLLWEGAGTGRVRAPLLRAHPLEDGDVLDGAAFAPRLAHATLERRVFLRRGPLRVGAAAFVDAAITGHPSRRGGVWLDGGAGLFADVGEEEVALDLAHGDEGWVLSARMSRRR